MEGNGAYPLPSPPIGGIIIGSSPPRYGDGGWNTGVKPGAISGCQLPDWGRGVAGESEGEGVDGTFIPVPVCYGFTNTGSNDRVKSLAAFKS